MVNPLKDPRYEAVQKSKLLVLDGREISLGQAHTADPLNPLIKESGWWQHSTIRCRVWVTFPSEPVGMKGKKTLEVTHGAALFQHWWLLKTYTGLSSNSCFRTAGCTCSALTTTTSSMLLWREVPQGGWLWGQPCPHPQKLSPSPRWGFVLGMCISAFLVTFGTEFCGPSITASPIERVSSFSLALLIHHCVSWQLGRRWILFF